MTLQPLAPASALMIKLAARPDFSQIERMPRGPERKQAAYDAIVATAQQSQAPMIALAEKLQNEGAITGYQTLVSPNMLIVNPAPSRTPQVTAAFHAAEGVKAIYRNRDANIVPRAGTQPPSIAPPGPSWGLDVIKSSTSEVAPPTDRPYGLDLIGAPAAWDMGALGEGLVYGSIDTGVDVTHEAIADRYRGRNADGSVNHDHNWFDPTGATAPKDDNGHGTHTIGTVTGAGIGVAPKAKFISANGLVGASDAVLRSLQWMLAPTKMDGTGADPTKAPDVVGMSWWTGRTDEDFFHENIQDLQAAGIVPVKSAGNRGPGAQTISSPGQFKEIIAVGAVDSKGNIASFSSRGPAPFPSGELTPKPDISAPGVDTVSAAPGNKYVKMSGTSMAQPHMSGVVLAILSKYPQLTHEQLMQAMQSTATDKGAPGMDVEYGAGIINLPAALDAAAKLVGAAPASAPAAAA